MLIYGMGGFMKKNEEMYGTNRMAIKMNDNAKVYIDRLYIDDIERYIISIPEGAYINGVKLDSNSVILFQKMLISDSEITLKTVIQENIAFKETYFVNDGYLDTHLRSYIPMPEEYGSSREMYLELAGVKEICTDLDMFKDMMNDRLIIGKVNDLSNYGLYFPQMKVLKKK